MLYQNWKLDDESLTKEQKEKLRALIFEHADIFSTGEGDMGRTTMAEHIIDTGAAKPTYQGPYRAEHDKQDVTEMEGIKMFEKYDRVAVEKLRSSLYPSR